MGSRHSAPGPLEKRFAAYTAGLANAAGHEDRHNENPKPFIWTAKANDILEKVKRARKALNNAQSV